MTALFKAGRATGAPQDWARVADRRSAPVEERLRAGLFLRYQQATGVQESTIFERNAKTWALFEHAVLPELTQFKFFDRERAVPVSATAVLAEGMFHIWTATDLGSADTGQSTTLEVITALANHLCSTYATTRLDKRKQRRRWFPL